MNLLAQSGAGPTAVVAEDEPVLRDELVRRLKTLWPELAIVGIAANGVEAVRLVEAHAPHFAFLDVEMPGLNGLDAARQVAGRCHVVFVTAYDAHAVAAFEQGAVDYILKPYDNGRLATALKRLRERTVSEPAMLDRLLRELAEATRPRDYLRWVRASRGSEIDLIMVSDVCYFQAETKYTTVCTATHEALIRRSIKDLAAELDPQCFWQIHRSTIVNIEAIDAVMRGLTGMKVRLRARSERLAVSEAYRHLFKHM